MGRLSTDLTSEFTFFNLVIRLSKVKQSAFFHVSPVVSILVELLAAVLGNHLLFRFATLTAAKPPFSIMLERQTAVTDFIQQGDRTCFRFGSPSFLVFSVRSTSRAPN